MQQPRAHNENTTNAPEKLAYTPAHAAAVIDVSPDFFDKYVRPNVKVCYVGRKRLIARAELARWLEKNGRGTA